MLQKFLFRLKNLRTPLDYIWLIFLVLNVIGLVSGIVSGNLPSAMLSGLIIFIMLL